MLNDKQNKDEEKTFTKSETNPKKTKQSTLVFLLELGKKDKNQTKKNKK